MPKHTGMSQEKKNTDTKEWCSHSHVGGSEFPKRGTAPSPSPPARRRLRGSAAGHARLLAASDAAVFPPPRAYRRTVALGGGALEGLGVLAHVDLQRRSGRCRGSAGASQAPVVAPV